MAKLNKAIQKLQSIFFNISNGSKSVLHIRQIQPASRIRLTTTYLNHMLEALHREQKFALNYF